MAYRKLKTAKRNKIRKLEICREALKKPWGLDIDLTDDVTTYTGKDLRQKIKQAITALLEV